MVFIPDTIDKRKEGKPTLGFTDRDFQYYFVFIYLRVSEYPRSVDPVGLLLFGT